MRKQVSSCGRQRVSGPRPVAGTWGMVFVATLWSAAAAAEPPIAPLPPYESSPPPGVLLDVPLVSEPLAEGPEGEPAPSAGGMPIDPETGAAVRLLAADDGGAEKAGAKGACSDEADECREALAALRDDDIRSIALDIRVGGRPGSDYPCECRLQGETYQPRRFATTMMTWKAAGYCHKPLYFEDWNLERYGHSHGPLDPVFSAAHFFVTLPVLPYKMGVELPWECVYPLGYYRPGNCAPWTVPAVPISLRGALVEAATVTGIVFALP